MNKTCTSANISEKNTLKKRRKNFLNEKRKLLKKKIGLGAFHNKICNVTRWVKLIIV